MQPLEEKISRKGDILLPAAKGQTVVMCHGVFDILHAGHIAHLEEARKMGDFLVVGLTTDTLLLLRLATNTRLLPAW